MTKIWQHIHRCRSKVNLELMKISAYYKKNREIVILSPEFSPDRHQKYFLRKDYDDGIYPMGLETVPNLEYGGYAFTNGIYAPLDEKIEQMHPDTTIYSNMEKAIMRTGNNGKKIFQNMMEAEHCRLSLDGKTIWSEYPRQFKFLKTARNLMIHDYDLGAIDGALDEVKRIMARARNDGWATRLGMKFPVCARTGQDLIDWMGFRPNSTFYSLRYDGVIDDDCFDEMIGINREHAVYSQLEYYVTATSRDEKEFLDKYIQRIYRQVVRSRTYRVFFSLKYEENFFSDKRWERIIELFNFYHNSMRYLPKSIYFKKIANDTLFDFAKSVYDELPPWFKKEINKQEMRELFHFVRENIPSLFEDFYEYKASGLEE